MILLILKVISLVVTFCIIIAIIIIGIEVSKLNAFFIRKFIGPIPKDEQTGGAATKTELKRTLHHEAQDLWVFGQTALDSGQAGELKSAILSLDSFCDQALKDRGYGGETMGERLKEATLDNLPAIQRLWTAHRIRNRVAHEPGKVTETELKEAVNWYGSVLREWRFIS